MKKVTIYTDGSCLGNPGPGGWASILIYGQNIKKTHGSEINTTNNRMEIKATIEALKLLKETCQVELYTDSKYVYMGITEYIAKWQQKNWRTSTGKVKNLELWQELLQFSQKHQINWHWVKAHSGDYYNEQVDQLANQAAQQAKKELYNV